jgi:tetratricopeptide (TPR) repeat protein
VVDNPRIDDLRRRVERDPTSIAFAQLAEECRRSGDPEEAVRVARAGLEQHPLYLSARVTLGRALAELGRFDEAKTEFQHVLAAAPDNLVALRSMANLHQQRVVVAPPVEEAAPAEAAAPEEATYVEPVTEPVPEPPAPALPPDPVLQELEAWLAAILMDRESQRSKVKSQIASSH